MARNMDLMFRKEVVAINAESEVTRAWRVFVAETAQMITLPLYLTFWGHMKAHTAEGTHS